jgi:hypothetical protein
MSGRHPIFGHNNFVKGLHPFNFIIQEKNKLYLHPENVNIIKVKTDTSKRHVMNDK